jgi:hypothetical protein
VSRARYDAHIYTNDEAELAHDLSREATHSTAISAEHESPEQSTAELEQGPEHSTEVTEHLSSEASDAPSMSEGQGVSIGE